MSKEDDANARHDKVQALIIGAGPAGLMAADALASAGAAVLVVDAMPSVGRKFLMAGKSGLNLTKDEPLASFLSHFHPQSPDLLRALTDFGPDSVQSWARDLGEPIFTGTTARVFPKTMKASPLLRRWLARLNQLGVTFEQRHKWVGWEGDTWLFDTSNGPRRITAEIVVMALGGASWSKLGSDGSWADLFQNEGIETTPFAPANMGVTIRWSPHMTPHFGTPVKGVKLMAGGVETRGEWVVTSQGLEGGGIYELSRALRSLEPATLDLLPDVTLEQISAKLRRPRGKLSISNYLRKMLKLPDISRALLMEWGRPLPVDADLPALIKALPVPIAGTLPMDGAISTAGGVDWSALNGFELKSRPGTFVAGEMLDWEAPTGGYLITGCLATGRAAGQAAAAKLNF